MILLFENSIKGGISSIMGNKYVKSDENKKILYEMQTFYMVGQCHNLYQLMNLNSIKISI